MKRVMRAALFVLLLSMVRVGEGYAQIFDFSAVCPTGQTLYYKITNITYHHVELTCPGPGDWNGFTEPAGDIMLQENVTYNGIDYIVTSIGGYAFYYCSGLTGSLTIPNSVTSIGHYAFYYCSGFTGSLTIPDSVISLGAFAFKGCSGFTGNLIIGNSVTEIGTGTFSGCSGFTGDLTIGNSVTSICDTQYDDYNSFSGCSGFVGTLTIGESLHSLPPVGITRFSHVVVVSGNTKFDSRDNCNAVIRTSDNTLVRGCKNTIIPNSVTTIRGDAFYNCTGLTGELIIPNSVVKIEDAVSVDYYPFAYGAFENCTELTSLVLGNSLTKIGSHAFANCSSLTSISITNPFTSIPKSAFIGTAWYEQQLDGVLYLDNLCLGYKGNPPTGSLVLNGNTRGVADEAFSGCSELTGSLTIPNSVKVIGKKAFNGCSGFTGSLTIGNSVISIDSDAFNGCSGFREIYYNAKDCDYDAWSECSEITTIAIGDSVEVIRGGAFSEFENLTTISIGKSVKSIGGSAFASNPRLNMVYYNVEKDLESANNVFNNCPNLTTIHIGADVQEIGSNIFKGCNTVHFVVALGPTPAVLDAGAFSDIVDNSVLMVSCGKRVAYYSVWNMFPFNNIIEDCDTYGINVGAVGNGGTITPSVIEAQMGQQVQITITPNPGMVLVSIKVCNANDPTQIIPITPTGKAASNYSFVMPPFEVVVMATFTTANTSVEENITASIPASVYPNPTTGFVKVEAEGIRHISISNILGQVIYDGNVTGNEFEYNFSMHGKGLYLIRIETTSGVAVKKVSVR